MASGEDNWSARSLRTLDYTLSIPGAEVGFRFFSFTLTLSMVMFTVVSCSPPLYSSSTLGMLDMCSLVNWLQYHIVQYHILQFQDRTVFYDIAAVILVPRLLLLKVGKY